VKFFKVIIASGYIVAAARTSVCVVFSRSSIM
jgi:hypothetical protein